MIFFLNLGPLSERTLNVTLSSTRFFRQVIRFSPNQTLSFTRFDYMSLFGNNLVQIEDDVLLHLEEKNHLEVVMSVTIATKLVTMSKTVHYQKLLNRKNASVVKKLVTSQNFALNTNQGHQEETVFVDEVFRFSQVSSFLIFGRRLLKLSWIRQR